MSFEPRDYLRHIAAEADYLLEHSASLTFDAFTRDQTLRRAFVRSLEIIGEASRKVGADFRAAHPAIPWREMNDLRNVLIHQYEGADTDLVLT